MKLVVLIFICAFCVISISASPIWKVFCGGPLFRGRVDPIVNPGAISGHSHKVFGGNHFSAAKIDSTPMSVFDEMYSSSCTTCSIGKVDMSAYWHPDLYYQWPNGSFSMVPNSGLTVYYLSRSGSGDQAEPDWQPIPKGLRMLAGNPFRRSDSGSVADSAINYVCLTAGGAPGPDGEPTNFPTGDFVCQNGLRAQVFFPMCWDGVNLDSADHKSHMSYPIERANSGNCPDTHPVRIPGVFMEALYGVDKFPHGTGTNPFVWSNGDPTGYGLHADFLSGWDEEVMAAAIADPACDVNNPDMAFGNNVRACPPLAPYVQDTPGEGDCSLAYSIPLTEDLGFAGVIEELPGCNPLTYGPENAVPCSLSPQNAPQPPVEKRYHLVSRLTGKYLTAPDDADSFLLANETKLTLNEVFDTLPLGGINVAIMSETYGNYLSAGGTNSRIVANRGSPDTWETFQIESQGTNSIAIISLRNNKYLTVQSDMTIAALTDTVEGDAQIFEISSPNGGAVGTDVVIDTSIPPNTFTTGITSQTNDNSLTGDDQLENSAVKALLGSLALLMFF